MRKKITKSKNKVHYSIIEDYTNSDGNRTTRVVENLGNQEDVEKRFKTKDIDVAIENYIKKLKSKKESIVSLYKNPNKRIPKNIRGTFNVGYLFLKKIYYELKLNLLCDEIKSKYKFEFDLNDILQCLIYSRILWPASKISTYEKSKAFLQKPNFKYHDMLRALSYLTNEFDFIQKFLFDNSNKIMNRNYKVIYYDCTNFFMYTNEDDFTRLGISKEHQPLPLVQMGLFMDGDGLPFAMNINPGNTGECTTMIPTEEKFLKDYNMDGKNIVVCTDAAMCSDEIKNFNVKDGRGFVITQSIKKLNDNLKKWSLDLKGWRILGNIVDVYNIEDIAKDEDLKQAYYDTIFYKEIECETKSVKQTLIVTFSFKYQEWQRKTKQRQYESAERMIQEANKANKDASKKKDVVKIKLGKSPNDPRRFVKQIAVTPSGKSVCDIIYEINEDKLKEENQYNGFYGITTNLNDDTKTIIKVMNGKWEIEESFRIMKEEFDSDNIYLTREDRIRAHFLTCFLSLFIYRTLEHRLDEEYSVFKIIDCLRTMNVLETKGDGYLPEYTRSDLTDKLHELASFQTDTEIVTIKQMREILKKIVK